MAVIRVMKAQGVGAEKLEDVEIVIAGDAPFEGQKNLSVEEMGDFYRAQAILLAGALRSALPSGTIDRLLGILLVSKASHFTIPWERDRLAELTKERDDALADGVLSQRVCDVENDRAQLRSEVERLTSERDAIQRILDRWLGVSGSDGRSSRDVHRDVIRQEGSYETHLARRRDLAMGLGMPEDTDWVFMIGRVVALRVACDSVSGGAGG